MSCLAILAVTAAMVIDGDTIRSEPSVRLTGIGDAPFDTPETWRPECPRERQLGAEATGLVRALMPGKLCIIGKGNGGFGRDLGILYASDGTDVREHLLKRGLAKPAKTSDWCD